MEQGKHSQQRSGKPPAPTCENCVHTFRKKGHDDAVVCVAHLKTMPASNTEICNLHAKKTGRT